MTKNQMHPAEEICSIMKRAYQKNMVSSAGGCLSIYDGKGFMWISPTSQDKGHLLPEMIAKYDMDGNQLSEYAGSMEWDNHLAIYKARPDVKAIFHTHSSAMLSLVFARESLKTNNFASLAGLMEGSAQIPFSVPGSKQLCEDIVAAAKAHKNILTLDSHGTYILSESNLFDAFKVQDILEMSARTAAIAPALGTVLPGLTNDQIAKYEDAKKVEDFPSFALEQETLEERKTRSLLCELAKRAYENGVLDSYQASFSLRLGDDDFLITPSDGDVANLDGDDIVRVKNGKVESGKNLPMKILMHRSIYQTQKEVGSVLISTPAYAAAYCVTDATFDCTIDPELTFCIKGVGKYPFGTSDKVIAADFNPGKLAAVVENDFIVAAAPTGVKTLGIVECMEYATRSVVEMSIRGSKPVRISEYVK
ncbi:class II aldolase/adducin family protein [uncultured Sphaerochaeta sp.]|uniref:class II aldolase/adducin family protein n=1 Tax=uncultured Sphaerochaeta sp. TaxID=886478 RepID=UPI002A0A354F|nr:class II aldolase/adducin family protein [uncultured Sphaerochaeta sp.]